MQNVGSEWGSMDEVEETLKKMKRGKAAGVDGMGLDMLKKEGQL